MAAFETVISIVTDLVGSPVAPRGGPALVAAVCVIKLGDKGSHHQLSGGTLQTLIEVNVRLHDSLVLLLCLRRGPGHGGHGGPGHSSCRRRWPLSVPRTDKTGGGPPSSGQMPTCDMSLFGRL